MKSWRLSIDRRKASRNDILEELRAIAAGLPELSFEILPEADYQRAPDHGSFRDFTPIATLHHEHTAVLEYVAEEMLDVFDWLVDFKDVSDNATK